MYLFFSLGNYTGTITTVLSNTEFKKCFHFRVPYASSDCFLNRKFLINCQQHCDDLFSIQFFQGGYWKPTKTPFWIGGRHPMLVLQFQGELKIETSSGEPVIRMGEGSCAMLMMEEGKYYSLGEPGSTKTLLIGMNTAWFSDVFEGCKTFRDFIEESRNGGFRSLPLSGINNDVRRRVIPLLLLVPAKGGFLQNQLAEMIRAVVLTYLNLLQWPEEIWREELRKIKAYVLQSVLKEEKVPKIEELTTRYASSRHVFEKDCQKFTGLRPIELIAKIRLEEAYRLLQTTDKSVADVSHIVLYCSPSAFIKAFKKHYGGYTPGEARNALGIASFIR